MTAINRIWFWSPQYGVTPQYAKRATTKRRRSSLHAKYTLTRDIAWYKKSTRHFPKVRYRISVCSGRHATKKTERQKKKQSSSKELKNMNSYRSVDCKNKGRKKNKLSSSVPLVWDLLCRSVQMNRIQECSNYGYRTQMEQTEIEGAKLPVRAAEISVLRFVNDDSFTRVSPHVHVVRM